MAFTPQSETLLRSLSRPDTGRPTTPLGSLVFPSPKIVFEKQQTLEAGDAVENIKGMRSVAHYRKLAALCRSLGPSLISEKARAAMSAMAEEYERQAATGQDASKPAD